MAMQNITQSIKTTFGDLSAQLSGHKEFKYTKELFALLICGAVLVGGYYSYNYYTKNQERAAHYLFEQNVEEYERVLQEGKGDQDWASVETLFKLAYDQYPRSSVAPFLLVYQAEAMKHQNKNVVEITQLLDKAIAAMPKATPLRSYFEVKQALINLDQAEHKDQALTQLQKIANDEHNASNDVAAYHLGLYYWTHNDSAQAKQVWQKLIDSQKEVTGRGVSPWSTLAEQKLATIA